MAKAKAKPKLSAPEPLPPREAAALLLAMDETPLLATIAELCSGLSHGELALVVATTRTELAKRGGSVMGHRDLHSRPLRQPVA